MSVNLAAALGSAAARMPVPGMLVRQPSRLGGEAPSAADAAKTLGKATILGATAGKALSNLAASGSGPGGKAVGSAMGKWAFKGKKAATGAELAAEFAQFDPRGAAAKGQSAARSRHLAQVAKANAEGALHLVLLRISARHERAKSLQMLEQHAAAVADFSDVIESCPAGANARFRRGVSQRALGDFDRAAADIELAKMLTPSYEQRALLNLNYNGLADVGAVVLVAAGEEPEPLVRGCDDEAIADAIAGLPTALAEIVLNT